MLTFHPKPDTLLICDFDRGFKAPEMVKKRPVVVISPRRRKSTPQLCTVVPLSSSAPNPVEHGTAQSPQLLQAGDGRGRPGAGVRGRPRLSGRKTRHPAPPVIDTEHDPLAESIEANGLSVESLADYLQVFRYGCPCTAASRSAWNGSPRRCWAWKASRRPPSSRATANAPARSDASAGLLSISPNGTVLAEGSDGNSDHAAQPSANRSRLRPEALQPC